MTHDTTSPDLSSIASEIAADDKAAGSNIDKLALLDGYMVELIQAESRLKKANVELEAAKLAYDALANSIVPGLLDSLKIPMKYALDPETGARMSVSVEDNFRAYLPGEEADPDGLKAKAFFESVGQGGICKSRRAWDIHWATLAKTVATLIARKVEIPDFIKVVPERRAKVRVG